MRATDRVFGAVGGLMVLTALYLLGAGLVRGAPTSEGPPPVRITSPADGTSVEGPLEIRFATGAPLSMMPGGWGAGGFHMHAEVGGSEIMPGSGDIRVLPSGEYAWVIRGVPSGESIIRLFWSTAEHVPVAGGGSQAVRVVIPPVSASPPASATPD